MEGNTAVGSSGPGRNHLPQDSASYTGTDGGELGEITVRAREHCAREAHAARLQRPNGWRFLVVTDQPMVTQVLGRARNAMGVEVAAMRMVPV